MIQVPNLGVQHGDVIKLGKHKVVVDRVEWRGESWAVSYFRVIGKGSRLGTAGEAFLSPLMDVKKLGRWYRHVGEGYTGFIESHSSTIQDQTTRAANGAKEAVMPTVVKRSSKSGSTAKASTKPKASSNGKRTQADVDRLVPDLVKARKAGTSMRDLKAQHGFSDDGPLRAAMFRKGYNSDGSKHGESGGSIDASKAAGRKQVVKLRTGEGAPWYRLAFLTGMTESEVKKIVKDSGGDTGRVYVQSEAPAKASGAKASTGKRVTRRAVKADPS